MARLSESVSSKLSVALPCGAEALRPGALYVELEHRKSSDQDSSSSSQVSANVTRPDRKRGEDEINEETTLIKIVHFN